MHALRTLAFAALPLAAAAQVPAIPPDLLPAAASAQLARSLEAASAHGEHVWRDTPPLAADGQVNAYIEISRGDRRKWELDMAANARAIDRVLPEAVGGYPVNYGFVPQTVSYDGDPFDALVLGPPLPAGRIVQGVIVGLMLMEDEKGLDSKVVLAPAGEDGRPSVALTTAAREPIEGFFERYKDHEPGGFSRVPDWGSVAEGLAHVRATHAFFLACRDRASEPCRVSR